AGNATLGYVGDDEALAGVGDTRLVAKLGRPARAAHPDRARVRIDERDAPIGDRPLPAQSQVGLREDLLGRLQLALEPLDERGAVVLAPCVPARSACECARLAHRLLGTLSDLSGQPVDRPQCLTPADTRRRDRPHPLADRTAAVAQPTPRRKTGRL